MAKRVKRTGQTCPFCGATVTAVFEEPTTKAQAAFWYERHDADRDAEWADRRAPVCSRSGQKLGYPAWPTWVQEAHEKALTALRRAR